MNDERRLSAPIETPAKVSSASVPPAEAGAAGFDPARAFVGALLHLSPGHVLDAFADVRTDDLADPQLSSIAAVAFTLASVGIAPDPVAVLAEARRTGVVSGALQTTAMRDVLMTLMIDVPTPGQVRCYGVAVLDEALRERVRVVAGRLYQAADTASISTVVDLVGRELAAVRDLAQRRHDADRRTGTDRVPVAV